MGVMLVRVMIKIYRYIDMQTKTNEKNFGNFETLKNSFRKLSLGFYQEK